MKRLRPRNKRRAKEISLSDLDTVKALHSLLGGKVFYYVDKEKKSKRMLTRDQLVEYLKACLPRMYWFSPWSKKPGQPYTTIGFDPRTFLSTLRMADKVSRISMVKARTKAEKKACFPARMDLEFLFKLGCPFIKQVY